MKLKNQTKKQIFTPLKKGFTILGVILVLSATAYSQFAPFGFVTEMIKGKLGLLTWMSGTDRAQALSGTYGTQGMYSGGYPGPRSNAYKWVDASGIMWMFGGNGIDSAGNTGDLNDLWRFNPSTNQWSWEGGSQIINQVGAIKSADDTGSLARFLNPNGTVVDASGNIYVADTFLHTIRKISVAGVVTTFAGTTGVPGSSDGVGTLASFNTPRGLAIDNSGTLYVTDSGNSLIRKITTAGAVSTLAGSSGLPGIVNGTGSAAQFSNPYGIAVNSATGDVYVAENSGHDIRKITSSGVVTTLAGNPGVGYVRPSFSSPGATAVDSSLNVYVADSANHVIRKISVAGVVTTFAGTVGVSGTTDATGPAAKFNSPQGIAIDSSNNIFVADTGNHTIRKITAAGIVSTFAGGATVSGSTNATGTAARFFSPQAVAVDTAGNVYVADTGNQLIRKITSAAVVTTLAGTTGVAGSANGTGIAATFNSPQGVTVDSSSNVYVADTSNNTIRKVTSAGVVSTFAGTAGAIGATNATGTAARFFQPRGLAVDTSLNIYVADGMNNAIRKITSAGVVTTAAGSAIMGSSDGTGTAAHFSSPQGLCVDTTGNVYIADTGSQLIRKMTSAFVVTTYAGTPSLAGSNNGNVTPDGAGTAAQFNSPTGLAIDSSGNLFVADSLDYTLRQVTSGGVVTTVAGQLQTPGISDGTGTAAQFDIVSSLAVDSSGNIFVADTNNSTIRKVTSGGVVATFAGVALTVGASDGTGTAARFKYPAGIAVDNGGNLYVADTSNYTIRKITSAAIVSTLAGTAGVGIGAAHSANWPGARESGVTWVDSSGTLWLLGGYGNGLLSSPGNLSDLWNYNQTTKLWTLVRDGYSVEAGGLCTGPRTTPGARIFSTSWVDSSGNFWLFGGNGFDCLSVNGDLNDLWKYAPSTDTWTSIGTPRNTNDYGNFGTIGSFSLTAPVTWPSSREEMVSWQSGSGASEAFWIFGGVGFDSLLGYGTLNDLWKYTPSNGAWTWVHGSGPSNALPVFTGTSSAVVPGATLAAASFSDNAGNFWLFGGNGRNSATSPTNGIDIDQLWKYNPATNFWTFIKGTQSSATGLPAVYGTMGTAASTNMPSGRNSTMAWYDVATAKIWLMAGMGYGNTSSTESPLNDLWNFNTSTTNWTWMGGASAYLPTGVYGTMGTSAANNLPGARSSSGCWNDSSGNVWLLGGHGYGSDGALAELNDFWKYSTTTQQWTWMSGPSTSGMPGVYGTLRTPSTSNFPGARTGFTTTIDSAGNFWFFGGAGLGSSGGGGTAAFNDLWKFNPSTQQWTWMSGSSVGNITGTFGTKGVAASPNMPSSRLNAGLWVSGNFVWLFGGIGFDSVSSYGNLNDLWKFDLTTYQWTWVSGTSLIGQLGTYGTLGVGSTSNIPGGRQSFGAVGPDSNGKIWIFGGEGASSVNAGTNDLNDLWSFDLATSQWTWVAGSNLDSQPSLNAGLNVSSPTNTPSARHSLAAWMDASGLYIFGGRGLDTHSIVGSLQDFWKFNFKMNRWIFMGGTELSFLPGVYGTKGVSAPAQYPGTRELAAACSVLTVNKKTGPFWLFGGSGYDKVYSGSLRDLWQIQ